MRRPSAVAPPERAASDLIPAARGGAANLIGSAVTGAVAFTLTVLVARSVSRPEAGVFFSTTSLFLLVTILGQLGTATGVVYFVTRARALGATDTIPQVVRTAIRPVIAVGLVAAVATFVFAPRLARLTLGGHASTATVCLRVLAVFIPVVGVEAVWLAASRGFGSMRVNAGVELIGRPLAQVALVAAVVPTGRLGLVALAWAAPYAVAAVLSARAWARRGAALGPVRTRSGVAGAEPSRATFWRFTGPRALTSAVQMLMQRFDIILVGALAGASAAAVYAAATRFVVVGQSVTTAFTQAIQPMLGAALVRQDHRAAAELYQLSTAWLVVLTWPVYLVLLVFHGTLVDVFGRGYHAGAAVLIWLSVSMLVATGCGLVDVVLSMAGHTGWNLANAGLALACNVALALWLIPRHGIIGAAIGWAAAITVRNLAALVQVVLAVGLQPFARSTGVAAVIASVSFGAVPWALREACGDSWHTLSLSFVAGAALWLAALWGLRGPLRLDAFALPRLSEARGGRAVQHGDRC